jgi:hypothetical protein
MVGLPLGQTCPYRLPCARARRPTLLEVPARRRLVEPIAGVLDDDQPAARREQVAQLGKCVTEVGNMVQGPARYGGVKALRVLELLERDASEDRARGRARVDPNDSVTRITQLPREPAITATDVGGE